MVAPNSDDCGTSSTSSSTYASKKLDKPRQRNSPPVSPVQRISFDNVAIEKLHTNISKMSRGRMSSCSKETLNAETRGSGSSSNPHESLNGRHNEKDKDESRAVVLGRELFVAFILLVAGVFGCMFYFVLYQSERHLAIKQFNSVTDGALNNIRNLAETKLVHGSYIMAKHVGWTYPNADEDWPFVWLPSYWDIMEEVLPTSIWNGVNLAPIVRPEQAEEFEEFAYGKIAETFGEDSDMGATSHFGKGIWVKDEKRVDTIDHRYHDTTGAPLYPGSPYNYLAPKLQNGRVFSPCTMMNVHGFEIQGLALDAVMNCSIARKQNHTEFIDTHGDHELHVTEGCRESGGIGCDHHPKSSRCSALGGMLPTKDDNENGIAGFIATPIYPANDPYELVGYIFGIIDWVEVMADVFPKDTIGIDCVFGDPNTEYTFTLDKDGEAIFLCEGDCHDAHYDPYKMTTNIIDPDFLSDSSVTYQMSCYPTDEFFNTYHTKNPIIAAIGSIGIILFTSMMFFLYDYFVRREFQHKNELFEAKRKFVRFVSHEVRTPMNSVCMGLSVLQEEAAAALGYGTSLAAKQKNKSPDTQPYFGKEQIERLYDLANEISANAVASVDVLDDFLNYDKIATGEMTLEYTIVPIWNLIDDTVAEFKLPMTKKNIILNMSLPNADDILSGSGNKSGAFFSSDTIQKSNKNTTYQYGSNKDSVCFSDDTIQKTNKVTSFAREDKGISDMEAGCQSDLLEKAQKEKLVGDYVRITQVIRNLVSNAIKFSKEGGDISISTRFVKSVRRRKRRRADPPRDKKTFELKSKEVITCEKTGEIIFTVKDSGAGLSKPQLKNLFGAGVQFDVNDLQSGNGSGLGLYIAKGIVEQHGGSLVADSEGKDLGCTFTMRLPIYTVPDDVYDQQQVRSRRRYKPRISFDRLSRSTKGHEPEQVDARDCTLKSLDSRDNGMSELKILLVDDSKSNRKLLNRLMTMRGHRCEQAEDGQMGLEMAIKAEQFAQPYDLIFMDYEMPRLNGPDAVKQIRQNDSNVYIIGLTGNIMPDDVAYFHACGANAVFPKPFKIREFERLLEENLSRDGWGRIIEKGSTVFDLNTLGLAQKEEDISPLGIVEEGDAPANLDGTGISSLGDPLDDSERRKL